MKQPISNCIFITALLGVMAGCMSPPKPAVADGSSRVMINDPDRISYLQQQTLQEKALLAENNSLKGELASIRSQLDEMRGLVRAAVTLPPPEPIPYMPTSQPPQSATPSGVTPAKKPVAIAAPRPRAPASGAGQGGALSNTLSNKP